MVSFCAILWKHSENNGEKREKEACCMIYQETTEFPKFPFLCAALHFMNFCKFNNFVIYRDFYYVFGGGPGTFLTTFMLRT